MYLLRHPWPSSTARLHTQVKQHRCACTCEATSCLNSVWSRTFSHKDRKPTRGSQGHIARSFRLTTPTGGLRSISCPIRNSVRHITDVGRTAGSFITTWAVSSQRDSQEETVAEDDDDHEPEAFILLLAGCIGLATGGGVVLFNYAIHEIQNVAWGPVLLSQGGEWARTMEPRQAGLWKLIIAPPLVGALVVSGLQLVFGEFGSKPKPVDKRDERPKAENNQEPVVSYLAASSGGPLHISGWLQHGQTAWRHLSDSIRPVVKTAAAAVSLGTGASLGPEGPSVEIGKAFATSFAGTLRSRRRHITSLLAAGSAAGVAAGFNAPIAGVFFAVETVLRREQATLAEEDESYSITIAAVLLASVLAAVVSQAGLGSAPAFRVPDYMAATPQELPLFMILGLLCGATSALSTYSNKLSDAGFDRLRAVGIPGPVLPVIGGAITGSVAILYPEILYQGFNNVNAILKGGFAYEEWLLLQILVAKIVITSLCRGSGLVGGIYAPSIFQGAALGSLFGCIVGKLATPFGLHVAETPVYALVGVAGILAANCRVPLTSVLLLFELTRDYTLILPTLLSVGLSFWAVQFCLRALAALAAYTPDLSELRGDEAPPFTVTREMPFLSLVSMLASDSDPALKSTAAKALTNSRAIIQGPNAAASPSASPSATSSTADIVSDQSSTLVGNIGLGSQISINSSGSAGGNSSSSSSSSNSSRNSVSQGEEPSSVLSAAQISASADGSNSPTTARATLSSSPAEGSATGSTVLPSTEHPKPSSRATGLSATAFTDIPQEALSESEASSVSVQCAAEESCLIFYDDTGAEEALAAFDATGKSIGVIQGEDGKPIGVVTRDSVVRALDVK